MVRRNVHVRRKRGWGPARIGHPLGMHPSIVNRVLRREGLPPLNELDLALRRELRGPVVRYESARPGELVHVDMPTVRCWPTRPPPPLPPWSRRAVAWFAAQGATVERVLTDNGSCYRSELWRKTCADLGVTPAGEPRDQPVRSVQLGERFWTGE
jgi:transposase InsO family protein